MTLVFFMYLVDQGKDKASFGSIGVLSLGMALSFGFIGGTAAAEGYLPFAKKNPIRFTVVGGFAAFLITFMASFAFFEREAKATAVKDVAKDVAKDASSSEAFSWTAVTTVPFEMAVAQLERAKNVSVDYSKCPNDFERTPVDAGTHAGGTPMEYLENLQDRLADSINIKYTVESTGRRYVIICEPKPR